MDLTGEEPLPPLEDPNLPPASPPRSPLLTGLILGLLLVVLSIAIFNLTRDDETTAATHHKHLFAVKILERVPGTERPAHTDRVASGELVNPFGDLSHFHHADLKGRGHLR